jgi:hypothetical protein
MEGWEWFFLDVCDRFLKRVREWQVGVGGTGDGTPGEIIVS